VTVVADVPGVPELPPQVVSTAIAREAANNLQRLSVIRVAIVRCSIPEPVNVGLTANTTKGRKLGLFIRPPRQTLSGRLVTDRRQILIDFLGSHDSWHFCEHESTTSVKPTILRLKDQVPIPLRASLVGFGYRIIDFGLNDGPYARVCSL
jgi:hypothetical protein